MQFGQHQLSLLQGDLCAQTADALVNAANSALAGGGGVDGALHQAAGPEMLAELHRRYPQGCPAGQAVVTSAGRLPARYVFHAVAPIWQGGHRGEPALLGSAYRVCLDLARQYQCQSIAFPSLGTGAYRYPIDLAAETALSTLQRSLAELSAAAQPLDVRLVLFDSGAFSAYARVLELMVE